MNQYEVVDVIVQAALGGIIIFNSLIIKRHLSKTAKDKILSIISLLLSVFSFGVFLLNQFALEEVLEANYLLLGSMIFLSVHILRR